MRRFTPPPSTEHFLDRMEVEFSSLLRGKTLLGEIVLSLDSCDLIASHLRALIEEAGQIAGTSFVTEMLKSVENI